MRVYLRFLVVLFAPVLLTQCETMDTVADAGTIVVEGTQFYPDEIGLTYVVTEGAQIIGAGGSSCHFVVKKGGSLVAHSGGKNTYKIETGGHFRGFTHPAEDCTVTYEEGAFIEQEQTGPGTRFIGM